MNLTNPLQISNHLSVTQNSNEVFEIFPPTYLDPGCLPLPRGYILNEVSPDRVSSHSEDLSLE